MTVHDNTKSCISNRSLQRTKRDQWISTEGRAVEFIDMVSRFHFIPNLQETISLPLMLYQYTVSKNITQLPWEAKKILCFPTTYLVRPDFLHILQSKHIKTDWVHRSIRCEIQLSDSMKPNTQEVHENKNQTVLLTVPPKYNNCFIKNVSYVNM